MAAPPVPEPEMKNYLQELGFATMNLQIYQELMGELADFATDYFRVQGQEPEQVRDPASEVENKAPELLVVAAALPMNPYLLQVQKQGETMGWNFREQPEMSLQEQSGQDLTMDSVVLEELDLFVDQQTKIAVEKPMDYRQDLLRLKQ